MTGSAFPWIAKIAMIVKIARRRRQIAIDRGDFGNALHRFVSVAEGEARLRMLAASATVPRIAQNKKRKLSVIAALFFLCFIPLCASSQATVSGEVVYTEPERDAQETLLRPKAGVQTLHLAADGRAACTVIGEAFGIKVTFDSSARTSNIRLDLNNVTFERAMDAVTLITRNFWTPVSSTEVAVAADTPANRKELERWLMRTFYLPDTSSPEELTEIASLLRTMFDIRSVVQSAASATISVRAPGPQVLAATRFLETLWTARPQVVLDFEVYEVTRQAMREAGIIVPYQVTLFPVSVNTLDNVAELSNIGIQFPPATANLSSNESRVTSLSRTTLRASHNNPATFRLGTRYPVITAAQTVGTTPVTGSPLVTYEDLGISVRATPAIHKNDVTLELEMDIDSLGSEVLNGIPTIASRKYKGSITVRNDEPAMVAGSLSRSEIKSLQSIPGIGYLPLLGPLTSNDNTEEDTDEVLVVVTPHIVSDVALKNGTEIFLP